MDALSQYDSLKSLPSPSPETLLLNSLFSEMLQMRAEMAALKARPEADESLKSAKEELAAARAEIAELKMLQMRAELATARAEIAELKMLQMRAEMAALKARPDLVKEELVAARAEIAELKTLVDALIGGALRRWGVNIPESDERAACLKKYVLEHLGGREGELHRVYLG